MHSINSITGFQKKEIQNFVEKHKHKKSWRLLSNSHGVLMNVTKNHNKVMIFIMYEFVLRQTEKFSTKTEIYFHKSKKLLSENSYLVISTKTGRIIDLFRNMTHKSITWTNIFSTSECTFAKTFHNIASLWQDSTKYVGTFDSWKSTMHLKLNAISRKIR